MRKSGIITAFLGIFMMVVPSKMSAQEDNGFNPTLTPSVKSSENLCVIFEGCIA